MQLFKTIETVFLSPDKEHLVIKFPYDEDRKEAVKQNVPGSEFKHGAWRCPVGLEQVQALKVLQFPITPQAEKYATEEPERRLKAISLSRATTAELELPGFGKQPFPFQKAGILYALDKKRVIIGDEMGLGKTIQGLGVVYAASLYPCLIVTPAANKYQWGETEVPACIPGKVVIVAEKNTGPIALQMADIIVTNYEQLIKVERKNGAFTDQTKKGVKLSPLAEKLKEVGLKAIIADEAHYLKNAKAARTLALMEVRKNVAHRILLTGTPVLNQPSELYSLLKFLDRIDEFGGYWNFMTRYCGLKKGRFGMEANESHHTKELNEKLRSTCYVRRKKEEVLKELPPKLRATYKVDITNWEEYAKARDELLEWVKERVLKDKEFMASIAHLTTEEQSWKIRERQLDKAEKAKRGEVMVRMSALKQVAAEGKLAAAKQWIDNFLESGEKLVIFAAHIKIQKMLLEWYPDACRITSDMSPYDRQENVKRFQSTDVQVFIGAMGTSAANSPAGVGHTLTAASNVLFLELGWNPALMDQCEDRCHRIGQQDTVNAHYLIARKTIEEYLARVIEDKRKVVAQVADGDEGEVENGILNNVVDLFLQEDDAA